MAIARRQGPGGPRFSDEMVQAALMFAGILLIVFFALIIRLYFDKREGKEVVLSPQRSPAKIIQSVTGR